MFALLTLVLAATPSPPQNTVTKTMAQTSFFVATTGNDSSLCTSAGAPCLTIQGALNKVPKFVRHPIIVSIGAGTFGCFSISGFFFDTQGNSQLPDGGAFVAGPVTGGASLTVKGTMATSTLASGSATGTVTSSTAGSVTSLGGTLMSFNDTGQSWTTNDLKARFVTFTSGDRIFQRQLIYTNTANSITLASISGLNPSVGSTYVIEEPATVINTACPLSPQAGQGVDGGFFSGTANLASIFVSDNYGYAVNTLRIMQFDVTAATGRAIWQRSLGGLFVDMFRARNVANTTTSRILIEQATDYVIVQKTALRAADSIASGVYGIQTVFNPISLGGYGVQFLSSMCEGGRTCLQGTVPVFVSGVVADPVSNFGLELRANSSQVFGFKCVGSTLGAFTACIRAGDSDHRGYCTGGLYFSAVNLSGTQAGNGINVNGKCVADLDLTTGSLVGAGLQAQYGAAINVKDSATNLTGTVADVQVLDASTYGGVAVNYSLAAIRAAGPPKCTAVGIPFGSAVCAQ